MVENPPANAGDMGSILGSARSPRVGNGNPFQYSCLENSMDRGAWRATDHGVAESQTLLSIHALCVQREGSGGQKSVKDGTHPPKTLLPPQKWNHFLPP